MKTRIGNISNSSSTSFIIRNISDKHKTLVDFVKENPELIEEFVDYYDWYKNDERFTQENLVISAEKNNISFEPDEAKECIFGDEDGSLIGHVFDYMLRDGGRSKSFDWRYNESLR